MTVVALDFLRDVRHLDARAASDLADWLVSLETAGKADRTISAYRLGIAKLLRMNMEKAVVEYRAEDIELWLASYPRRSRHICRAMGSQFFGWLFNRDRIERNPMDKVVKIKAPPRSTIDIFSEAERALLEGLPTPHGHYFSALFGSGIRRDEAIRLQWGHIDLDRSRLVVKHGKGDKPRIVPLLDFALIALSDLDGFERFNRDDFVFFRTRGPNVSARHREMHSRREPLSTSSFQRWYGDCIDAAGVAYRKPHTTRHTYNEILRQEGYDLEERQLLLGHASSRTTADIYGHLTIEDVARKMLAGGDR